MARAASSGPNHDHSCSFSTHDGVSVLGYRWLNPDKSVGGWVAETASVDASVHIHPSAFVHPEAQIGAHVILEAESTVHQGVCVPEGLTIPKNTAVRNFGPLGLEVELHSANRIKLGEDQQVSFNVAQTHIRHTVPQTGLAALLRDPVKLRTITLDAQK